MGGKQDAIIMDAPQLCMHAPKIFLWCAFYCLPHASHALPRSLFAVKCPGPSCS